MTIEEAIKHAKEVAEEHTKYNRYGGFESCDKCAEEHRQLAEWLRDYKRLLEQDPCEDAISRAQAIYVASGYCHPANVARELEKLPSVKPVEPCDNCEVGNPCLYCKHEYEPHESEVEG